MPPLIGFKLFVLVGLYLFVPLSAVTYYFSRRKRRVIEIDRILSAARHRSRLPESLRAGRPGLVHMGRHLSVDRVGHRPGAAAVQPRDRAPERRVPGGGHRRGGISSAGVEARVRDGVSRGVPVGASAPVPALSTTDLPPTIYYGSSIRIVLASVVALIIYNVYPALSGGSDSDTGITSTIWPALAFAIGVFPQRGLRWLTDRIPMLAPQGDSLVRPAPLEMIEGVESHDVLRLEELGIDTCYDLATVDFVPLLLKTPYSARQLIDWILQAKLCAYFGDTTKDLRRMGIRTIADLESLTALELEGLPAETSVTAPVLLRAHEAVKTNPEIQRLREVGRLLGVFWNRETQAPDAEEMAGRIPVPGGWRVPDTRLMTWRLCSEARSSRSRSDRCSCSLDWPPAVSRERARHSPRYPTVDSSERSTGDSASPDQRGVSSDDLGCRRLLRLRPRGSGTPRYSAAGHPPLLRWRHGRLSDEIESNGLLFGIAPHCEYPVFDTTIEPGDRFILYTDGVTETEDGRGEFFGDRRLEAVVRDNDWRTTSDFCDSFLAEVDGWRQAPVPRQDDITMVVVDVVA